MSGADPKHPRVFISYSHDSNAHADRVLALSDRLRRDGIDATVDQYELSPPEGWPVVHSSMHTAPAGQQISTAQTCPGEQSRMPFGQGEPQF